MVQQKLEKTGKDESKMKYFLEGKLEWMGGKRPRSRYMNEIARNKVAIIANTRIEESEC